VSRTDWMNDGTIGVYGGTTVLESRAMRPLDMFQAGDSLIVGDVRYLKIRLELSAWVKQRVAETAQRLGLEASYD